MKWLSAILVIILASGCRCFHVYCDECMSDQFSNSEMVRFRTDSGQFSLEELDTVFVYSIAAGSSDTILKILTDFTGAGACRADGSVESGARGHHWNGGARQPAN